MPNADGDAGKMKFAFFTGGLGDIIMNVYRIDQYRLLDEVEVPTPIIVASGNPFSAELFRFHRNAKNFLIYDLSHNRAALSSSGMRGPAEVNKALCALVNLPHGEIVRSQVPEGYRPRFDAPDDIDSDGHIILQPFAGAGNERTWTPEFTESVVRTLRRQSRPVFLLTRSFIRVNSKGRVVHATEDARRFAGGNVTVLENLSVPATLNLVRRSAAYVGSWTSLQQAAWFEGKPVAVYYPKNFKCVVNRDHYAHGLDRADCLHADYERADAVALRGWLEAQCPSTKKKFSLRRFLGLA